ncbi:hypothetical protein [Aeromonas veronii]|uniref:hypothetical protein n=1 Tax=Aeromonas veronii TaxID=654 RepID=UPI000D937318
MNILFWNVQKKDLSLAANQICIDEKIDLCIFAEASNLDESIITTNSFNKIVTLNNLSIFTKYSSSIVKVIHESMRYSLLLVNSPISGDVFICCLHLISKFNYSDTSILLEVQILMREIDKRKSEYNISHVIICGDFNQNPYEPAMVSAACFNATCDRTIAKKMSRQVLGKSYDYYYNPMWKFYAATSRPYGTYFHHSSTHDTIHWNILDQFIISSSLLDLISDNDFKIVTKNKNDSFVNRVGVINKKNFSDHLPIVMNSNI